MFLRNLLSKLAVITLSTGCLLSASMANAATVELNDGDYVEINIPAATIDYSIVNFQIGDSLLEVAKNPVDGEIYTIHAEKDDILGEMHFTLRQELNNIFSFTPGVTNPLGAFFELEVESTGENFGLSDGESVLFNLPGATMQVIKNAGDLSAAYAVDSEDQEFVKVGFLEFRVNVIQPTDEGNGNDDQGLPETGGGCSLLTATGSANGSMLGWLGMVGALAALRFRRKAE